MNFSAEEQLLYAIVIDNITEPAWRAADHIVMWIGQHGTTNQPIPKVSDRSVLTKPQDAFMYYCGYILRGINRWRDADPIQRDVIWLNADPRNYMKMRDLKHPLRHPVLTQFDFWHNIKHERYGDLLIDGDDVHPSKVENRYARLELNALLPGTPSGDLLKFNDEWSGRKHFGIVINEARTIGIKYEKSRLHAMENWVMPVRPAFVYGTWSEQSQLKLGITPHPLRWSSYTYTMHQVRCTFTTPSSGSGWATTKPWEAFGLGVVCFFHPDYDTQDNILRDADPKLRAWLRVKTPAELRDRVIYLSTPAGRYDWQQLVHLQKEHFDRNVDEPVFLRMINDRLENR